MKYPLSPDNYVRVTAITMHATLKLAIERAYPDLSPMHIDEMMIDVIDRMARMRGWVIRHNGGTVTVDEGE